ncbi:hypothetical protein C8034_v008219 [Colletotrichum sidae]|uniref:Uncharacterized protein n=1 Tax=Colletotrichum sidae TaxID=1347389 RepID=A0A4R8TPN0_9PEZI|nr:hypothetical protein C8034_v008219 [Colletotrichum sidae]
MVGPMVIVSLLMVNAVVVDTLGIIPTRHDGLSALYSTPDRAISMPTLGVHLAPRTFPQDNPLNITEEQALELGISIIPVDKGHWDALVTSSGLDTPSPPSYDLSRREHNREEVNPPDPTDWCTPIASDNQCTFGVWSHEMQYTDRPNRAWLFDRNCKLIGDHHPWEWDNWENMYSGLPWVTIFRMSRTKYPELKYAGRGWGPLDPGWELYFPFGEVNLFYYRRSFDCSR